MHLYFSHGYSYISECNDLTLPLLNTDYSRLLKITLQCFHRPNVQTSELFFEPLLGQAENFPASFNLRNLSSMSVVTLKIFYSLFLSLLVSPLIFLFSSYFYSLFLSPYSSLHISISVSLIILSSFLPFILIIFLSLRATFSALHPWILLVMCLTCTSIFHARLYDFFYK